MRPRAARHESCRGAVLFAGLGFRFLQQTCRNQGLEKRGYREWPSMAMALRIHLHVKLEGKTKTGAT